MPAIPPVPAAPVESDTKMDLLMNMLASANATRASALNSILNRMESLQEASTRASRVSLLGKYLQALLDVSGLVGDKKVLNGFVAALDRKDLPAAKTGLVRAARRCCSSDDVELIEDLLAALPAFPVERQVKRARKDISCFLCGGPHYQNHCPNRGSVGRVVPAASSVALCPFCRKPGHSESSCWTKHPTFPIWKIFHSPSS